MRDRLLALRADVDLALDQARRCLRSSRDLPQRSVPRMPAVIVTIADA